MNTVGFMMGQLHFQVHRAKLEEGTLCKVGRLLRQTEFHLRVAQL